MKSLTILVADDEEGIRALLEHCLVAEGHAVTLVSNATEAFSVLKQRQFDMVVTDILMPDGDGLALITEMRKSQPNARILAISGGGRYVEGDDCLRMAQRLGANALVMKPFTLEQLRVGIDQAMAPLRDVTW